MYSADGLTVFLKQLRLPLVGIVKFYLTALRLLKTDRRVRGSLVIDGLY
jgi:hypothetical protein